MKDIMEICPHSNFCGGCIYQGMSYADQLADKEKQVRELFDELRIRPVRFESIRGCEDIGVYRYRNKMEYTFGDMKKDGPLCLGMHKIKNFMSVVTVDECQIVPEDFNRILRYTLDFCTERQYPKYHKKRHTGLLRNLVLRRGVRTGEILVNIVTSTEEDFAAEEWKDGLLALPLDDRIVGIMHTLNDSLADAVVCDELRLLYGRDYYMEEICGLKFKVNMFSFFQTNVEAVERLYSEAVSLIEDVSGKTVFDLYCGTGTISQVLAQNAARVLGVEIVPDSAAAAEANAALNGLTNCEFACGDVFQVLKEREDRPDVICVDPPRVGMSLDAVQRIAGYGVPQILYISCNPKSLVKNLVQFREYGYEAEVVIPYDNFPLTRHVECICLLDKKNARSREYVEIGLDAEDYYRIKENR